MPLPSLDCPPPPVPASPAPSAAQKQGFVERLGRWAGEKLRPDKALLRMLGLDDDTPLPVLLDYLSALAADPQGLIQRKAAEVPAALAAHLAQPEQVTALVKGVLQLYTGGMLVPAIELLQRAQQIRDQVCEAGALLDGSAAAGATQGGNEREEGHDESEGEIRDHAQPH